MPEADRSDQEVGTALTNAIALLIITCPCALGLAVPAVQIVATSRLFRVGLLVKSGDALERLAEADTAVFDKTGTLTYRPAGAHECGRRSRQPILRWRRRLRAQASIRCRARWLRPRVPGGVSEGTQETPGEGLEARIDGVAVRLGRAEWVGAGTRIGLERQSSLVARRRRERPFASTLRIGCAPTPTEAVTALQALGLNVEMLSGDRDAPAQLIAGKPVSRHGAPRAIPSKRPSTWRRCARKGTAS